MCIVQLKIHELSLPYEDFTNNIFQELDFEFSERQKKVKNLDSDDG